MIPAEAVADLITRAIHGGLLPLGWYPDSHRVLIASFPLDTRGETYGARFDVNLNGARVRVEVTEVR